MSDAPERVHIRWGKTGDDRVSYMEERFLPPSDDAEYIRADLYEAERAENERLRYVLQSVRGAILSGRRVDALTILGDEFRY